MDKRTITDIFKNIWYRATYRPIVEVVWDTKGFSIRSIDRCIYPQKSDDSFARHYPWHPYGESKYFAIGLDKKQLQQLKEHLDFWLASNKIKITTGEK